VSTAMSMGWGPAGFEAGGDWQMWLLLTAVLVLFWGLVAAAVAALFASPGGQRNHRPVTAARDSAAAAVVRTARRHGRAHTAIGGPASPISSQAGRRDG
jgi:hypothetical protein